MKKSFIAALALLAFVGCNNKEKETSANEEKKDVAATETIVSGDFAYVNVELIIAESEIFKTEGKALEEKTEKTQKDLANRERYLQSEMQKLNEKYQKGLITTREANEKGESLQKQVAVLQNSAQKKISELEEENMVFQNRLRDLIQRAVQSINADKKFKMVVQASALLDADKSLDITQTVLTKVNELYNEDKKEDKK